MAEKTRFKLFSSKLSWTVFVLIAVQPLMDVLSYWTVKTDSATLFTLFLRFCLLALSLVLGFILSDKKKLWIILFSVLAVFTLCHGAICFYYGYDNIIQDLTNLIRIFHLPISVFSFVSFIKKDEGCLDAIYKGFTASFLLIMLIALIATVTGSDPHTYANKGIGLLGWFLTPNVQSSILSMAAAVFILSSLRSKKFKLWLFVPACILGFGSLFLFATRLAYASLIFTALLIALSCLLSGGLQKRSLKAPAIVLLIFFAAAVILVPLSPMVQNQDRVGENALAKQQDIDALVQADLQKAKANGTSEDELTLASLKSAYEKYLPGVTGRFGLKTAAETYGYSTSASKLADTRLQRINYCRLLLKEQPMSLLFGLELADLSFGDGVYDAENDFHGIFFLCGGAGLVLTLCFFGFLLLSFGKGLIKNLKEVFTVEFSGFFAAFCCGIAHAFFTAGVLRRPNSSFYLAIICAVLYCLSNTNVRRSINENNR